MTDMIPDWKNTSELPDEGEYILAVPVYCARSQEFIRWDTWTQDVNCDRNEEQEIGWRIEDAVYFLETPPAPPLVTHD